MASFDSYSNDQLVNFWNEEVDNMTASVSWLMDLENKLTKRGYYTRSNLGGRMYAAKKVADECPNTSADCRIPGCIHTS